MSDNTFHLKNAILFSITIFMGCMHETLLTLLRCLFQGFYFKVADELVIIFVDFHIRRCRYIKFVSGKPRPRALFPFGFLALKLLEDSGTTRSDMRQFLQYIGSVVVMTFVKVLDAGEWCTVLLLPGWSVCDVPG